MLGMARRESYKTLSFKNNGTMREIERGRKERRERERRERREREGGGENEMKRII